MNPTQAGPAPRLVLALAGMTLLASSHGLAQQERPTIWGRRLSAGPAGLLVLTEPGVPNRVVLYDVTGDAPRKVVAFGGPGQKPGQLASPHGATVSWAGELLVTNTRNHRIDVFDMASLREGRYPRLLRTFGAIGDGPGRFQAPQWPVAVSSRRDLQGLVFVSDTGNDRVQVLERTGKLVRIIGELGRPMAIAFDPSGNVLYVAESGNRRVSVFAATSGRLLGRIAEAGATGSSLANPQGLAVGPDGVVYVTDLGAGEVRRFKPEFDPKGTIVSVKELPAWGKAGTASGEILKPHSIAVDGSGRVYVADLETDRCQVFSADGSFLGAFGEDAVALTPLTPPHGLTAKLPETVCGNTGSFRVRIKPSRNPVRANERIGLEGELLEGCGQDPKPLEGVELRVDAVMPEHQLGATKQALVRPLGGGRFEVTGLSFDKPGYWELYFDVQRESLVERAQMEFRLE